MRLATIERGAKGQQVQLLQHLLNTTSKPRPPLELDGAFGAMTERVVRSYQAGRRLEADGVVGPETWKSLGVGGSALPPAPVQSGPPTRAVPIPSVRQLPMGTGTSPITSPPTRAVPIPSIRQLPLGNARPAGGGSLDRPGTSIAVPWMRVANAEKFVAEVAGAGNNRRIMEYHATTTLGSQPDSVPWCSSFVNWCLKQVGIRGTNSAAAASWVDWGQPLEELRYGCIVQIRTARSGHDRATGSSSGNHVAFFVSKTATHITLLGGNQGNQVKESNFRLSSYDIRAMRWPTGR
ncbi:TIGR02594 family protein [Sphingomonas sp. PL-96]|uniref:NlpC/P60 family protein n=1 Tax=Sphingomonas sp. PL-96 TaxID=2887201 RepID=UPI001E362E14|nr:TIGR02594 family protein [Sphingomonas sp. PL-96]MCC2975694.1 TIGR02594 family protein [Sphingomonas sp. PL-96]